MLWKIAPLAIALLIAFLIRSRDIRGAFAQRRSLRGCMIWAKATILTAVPVYLVLGAAVLIAEATGPR